MTESLLRRKRVTEVTGLSEGTIYHLMSKGLFPKPVKVGPRAVAWPATDIGTWVAERIAARNLNQGATK